jgi:hypothetical protein
MQSSFTFQVLPLVGAMSRRHFLGSALILSSNSVLSMAAAKSVSPTLVTSLTQLQSAIDSARSGDVIYLKNGTYRNNKLKLRTDGITVQAETPGGVFFNGSNQLKISGSRVVFRGFQFTEGEAPGTAIEVSGSDNLLSELNFSGYASKSASTSWPAASATRLLTAILRTSQSAPPRAI